MKDILREIERQQHHVLDLEIVVQDAQARVNRDVDGLREAVREHDRALVHLRHLTPAASDSDLTFVITVDPTSVRYRMEDDDRRNVAKVVHDELVSLFDLLKWAYSIEPMQPCSAPETHK